VIKMFSYYCLLIHILVFIFPLRASWAIYTVTRRLHRARNDKTLKDVSLYRQRRASSSSLSSLNASCCSIDEGFNSSSDGDSMDTDYTELGLSDGVIHAIIIPNYNEDIDTLRETLEVLASHPQASTAYDVSFPNPLERQSMKPLTVAQIYLAMEEREPNAEAKVVTLINSFVNKFHFITFTLHPTDLPGELPGKGSNMAWAARKLSERYSFTQRKDVIVTGIDGKHSPNRLSSGPR